MDDYGFALLLDVVTVLSCIALLLRYSDLRFSHPATPYITFHLHTVTIRLAGLLNGALPLYASSPGWFEAVRPDEITRAALYADLAFWSVTLVWILFRPTNYDKTLPHVDALKLDPRILRPVLLAAFIGGVIGLRVAAQIPGMDAYTGLDSSSDWSSSSYLIILPSWFGLSILGHMYYYGGRRSTNLLLAGYIVLMALQGGFRFRVIIALLMAVQIWVERRGRRWPSKAIVLGLVAAAVLFFPMKKFGSMAQDGADFARISATVSDSVAEATEGAAADHMFLDEFASALTLLDMQGRKYFGSIYLPLITLPIPRALWPDKPVLAGFITDISTRYRPMSSSGMITTYLGEAYANFGLVGIFLMPPLLAILLAVYYRQAYRSSYDSVIRFSYVLLSVNLIQVYRDGLLSLFVFTFVNMMPLVVIVIAHLIFSFMVKRREVMLKAPDAKRKETFNQPAGN